jgi:amino acid transporter
VVKEPETSGRIVSHLRRDLGTLEAYAALIGILIGAGIFKVTSQAWSLTGPSVILGYAVLMPAVLVTSVPYAAFLSTRLGREPGGEYTHISHTFGGYGIAYIGAWLKIIAYVGAGAYLSDTLADYSIQLFGGTPGPGRLHMSLAVVGLFFFYVIHVSGVRWFGRIQVAMCALLGLSILVLVVPGLFYLRAANYQPFVTHGFSGFAKSLLPLFFAYAGFESLAQTAGEVKDSTRRLPLIFLKGISATAAIYVLMSVVSFGVLPGARLQASGAPMSEVASVYLPWGTAAFVTFGAIMAITTSLNATLIVPSRLALMFVQDRLAPSWIGSVHPRTATPIRALTLTLLACLALLVSQQMSLALNIAVFALMLLYCLHSLAFLLLAKWNPGLWREVSVNIPAWLQRTGAALSLAAMGFLIALEVAQDTQTLRTQTFRERITNHSLTSLELVLAWGLMGAALYAYARWSAPPHGARALEASHR